MESFAEKFRAATEAIIAEAVEYLKGIDQDIEFDEDDELWMSDTHFAISFDSKDCTVLTEDSEGEEYWTSLDEIEGEKLCVLADTIKDILKPTP
jgi:beta-xylosidase